MATFEAAQESFLGLLAGLATDGDRRNFLDWIRNTVLEELPADFGLANGVADGRVRLRRIAEFTRSLVPNPAGVLPSETIYPPPEETAGKVVEALDAFLYDEEDEEQLAAEGKLSRHFCLDCGSRRSGDIEFVTHSCSRERSEFVFRSLLPELRGKTVLDVGSRLGAILYGAYFFSKASKIVGIEVNADLCRIQRSVIENFSMADRVSVVEAELTTRPDLLASADVVILNNVAEWFVPVPEFRVTMWHFVRQHLKPGALLVTIPDLETSFKSLQLPAGRVLGQWVRELNPAHPERTAPAILAEEAEEVRLYECIGAT